MTLSGMGRHRRGSGAGHPPALVDRVGLLVTISIGLFFVIYLRIRPRLDPVEALRYE